jgi:chromate transporter
MRRVNRFMSDSADPSSPARPVPTHADLFLAFAKITLSGFGGTLPWTRRMFIEEKRWLTEEEFNEIYALCQFLPGPNIVNVTAVFGSRMRGWTGAIAAWTGFLALPFCFMVILGALYAKFGDVDLLRRVLSGLAAAAAGLLIATVLKMAGPLFKKFSPAPFVLIATAVSIGVLRWPLHWVMLVLVPLSIGLSWASRRQARAAAGS